jgi:hypothetical protein
MTYFLLLLLLLLLLFLILHATLGSTVLVSFNVSSLSTTCFILRKINLEI